MYHIKKGIQDKNGYLSKGARSGAFSPVPNIQQLEYENYQI